MSAPMGMIAGDRGEFGSRWFTSLLGRHGYCGRLCFVLFGAVILLLPSAAQALESMEVRDSHVAVSIVSNVETVAPGETFWAGIRYRMDPDWHIYWKVAGDSGLAPEIEWEVPPGWEVGEVNWPAPEWYEAGGFVTFVYHGEVILFQEFRVPETQEAGSVILRAETNWLMCSVPCIPGKAALELEVQVGEQTIGSRSGDQLLKAEMRGWAVEAADELKFEAWFVSGRGKVRGHFSGLSREFEGLEATFFPETEDFRMEKPGIVKDGTVGFAGSFYEYAEVGTVIDGRLVLRDRSSGELRAHLKVGARISDEPPSGLASEVAPKLSAYILGAAFLGGLILNLMPCVLPVLGIKVLHVVGQGGSGSKTVWTHTGAYTLGILVSFWVLAAVVLILRSQFDITWGFQLQEPGFVFALMVILLIFGLNLSGLFELGGTLVGLDQKAGKGLGGSFFSGMLATTVSTPCSAPILGTAFAAVLVLPPFGVLLVATTMGLGLALPFAILATAPRLRRWIPKPGVWMQTFKQFLAFPIYATVGWLAWIVSWQVAEQALLALYLSLVGVAMGAWVYGRYATFIQPLRVRNGGRIVAGILILSSIAVGWPAREAPLVWEIWSPERVEELRAEGRPIYVDFTAKWCLTCMWNKSRVFGSDEVLDLFRGERVALLKADLTNDNPQASKVIHEFGRGAIPMNLVYPADGSEPVLLPELLGPAEVLEAFGR